MHLNVPKKVNLPIRTLSKSKLSSYLRTQCDRHLYLSLFKNNTENLKSAGIPIPLKTRPSIQYVTAAGREFELEQYDILTRAIPNNVIYNNNYSACNLSDALRKYIYPCFILQPEIEPEDFKDVALTNLDLNNQEKLCIPVLSGLRPDALFLHEASDSEYEVLPNGNRKRLSDNESRIGISVIDLKNVTEANASYAAEVCLYTYFLANWLDSIGVEFKDKYFISDHCYLWKHLEMPNFEKSLTLLTSSNHNDRIKALLIDLNDGLIEYLVFIPSVRKFFKEDIPRVVTKGDNSGWQSVEYHVSPKCGSCDWLGNEEWLFGEHKKHFEKNPDHYCLHAAELSEHLSQLSGLSKGASHILSDNGHSKLPDLINLSSEHTTLKKHSLLKRDKSQISARAKAIHTGNLSLDSNIKIAGLAKGQNLEFSIIVNFDAGTGLLSGIAISGIAFTPFGITYTSPDGTISNSIPIKEESYVVAKDNLQAEWVTLRSFIDKFSKEANRIKEIYTQNNWGDVYIQICFWESRQYEELCNAFSRHLLDVLQLTDKRAIALAWIFPADELMELNEQTAPGIVFIRDIVDSVTRLPVKFSHTLLNVADSYHSLSMTPRKVDTYYKEPLGNGIPRERIFEIWKSPAGIVKMYGQDESLADAITKYGSVLKSHAWDLATITRRLREDFNSKITGSAPKLSLSVPQGANRVAYDSKLWIQWSKVEMATAQTEAKMSFSVKPERLEASYKAIVLGNLINNLGNYKYEFEVNEESTEAKLEEGKGYFVLGFVNNPGFPLSTPGSLGILHNPANNIDHRQLNTKLNFLINVSIEEFDRVNKKIILQIEPRYQIYNEVFNELIINDLLPIETEPIYILAGLPYDDAEKTSLILKEIGNPTCATIAPEALKAMGSTKQTGLKGTDRITPISRVLWEAAKLSKTFIRNDSDSIEIADLAKTINPKGLNISQISAVRACAKNMLTIIWGPPGTGKTDTLASLLTSLVINAEKSPITNKILITGPNYRAVEELSERFLRYLQIHTKNQTDFYMLYSKSRDPKKFDDKLNVHSITFDDSSKNDLKISLLNSTKVTIVATTAHNSDKISELLYGNNCGQIQEIFDLIVIDESSQVPVTLALRPLALLKKNAQLIIAGDHLQMPPISSLEPPKNAEYLVGSIQSYLLKRFNLPKQELLINYRSNQDLVKYAKTLGYPNALEAFDKYKSLIVLNDIDQIVLNLPDYLPKTSAYKDLLLPENKVTAFIHEDIASSQANEFEAKLVAGLAYCLRNSMSKDLNISGTDSSDEEFDDESFFSIGVGIVTPHKAQKALVIRELIILFPNADPRIIFEAVDTVERFQGGERQTIIISFGVGDLDIIEGEEAFLLQMERINVAVSRAKAKSILLLPKSLAYYLPTDEKTIKTSVALKSYLEEFCNNRVSVDVETDGIIRSGEVRWH